MFQRFAPVLAAVLLVSGCVVVPTGTLAARKASLDKVQVAVALPEDTDLDAYSGGTPWNRARLTLSRKDGEGADLVQPLEAVKGGLRAKAPLEGLEPGDFYRIDLELIYEESSGLERVVARGALGANETLTLKGGSNTVKVTVAPTTRGDRVALEPTIIKTSSTTKGAAEDDEDEDDKEATIGDLVDTIVGVLAEASKKK